MLLALCENVSAQLNPVEGYIITNNGDTINGTLDYLSPHVNSKECHFQKEGENDFKIYNPGEIKGYRFKSDGVYYVSRTFLVDSVKTTFFAEFLLKGGVSLYRLYREGLDNYFIENEKGEVVQLKGKTGDLEEDIANEGKNLGPAFYIFSKSQKAREQLRKSDLSIKSVTQITREYDETYCQESGECVQYQYDARKSRDAKHHFIVTAGYGMLMARVYDDKGNGNAPGATIGAGVYYTYPRFNKHLSLEITANLSYYVFTFKNVEYSHDYIYKIYPEYKIKCYCISVPVIGNYMLRKENVLTPYFSLGVNNLFGFAYESDTNEKGHISSIFYPLAGFGLNIPSGKNIIRIGAYGCIRNPMIYTYDSAVKVSASYIF